ASERSLQQWRVREPRLPYAVQERAAPRVIPALRKDRAGTAPPVRRLVVVGTTTACPAGGGWCDL
ncbi:MAG TPA: hypothetical protein VKB37_10380, partial [Jatrophihabitantaceae bacterium]|nr:hypothetical protein [Jatrophihabitantaceae bacterium]